MPVATVAVSSSFGWRRNPFSGNFQPHRGVDLAAPLGTPVVATMDGTVVASGSHGGYGLLVSLANEHGLETRYGHLSRLAVSLGQQIHKGEVIGYVGSTGNSTGPHLHYEIRMGGEALDPGRFIHGR
jgi:murein DD-endopeptidase MepM/ murein hydrolase activator NlpD